MVFIHGLFGQNGQYQGMIKALEKEGVRLHTPSLRGYSTGRLSVRFSASEVLGAARKVVVQVYKDTQKKTLAVRLIARKYLCRKVCHRTPGDDQRAYLAHDCRPSPPTAYKRDSAGFP
jgi:hypothetical protein